MVDSCKDHDGKYSHKRRISYLFSFSLIASFFASLAMAIIGKMPWSFFIEEFIAISILIGGTIGVTAFSDALKIKDKQTN